jgi:ERCC4-type nuclease
MYLATILRDTRERRPWEFRPHPVETRDVTLSTGDYTVAACCSRDPGTGTYLPGFAVERKTGRDFLHSITWERERFEAQVGRADGWPEPLAVVVEETWATFTEGRGPMRGRDVHPGQVRGTVAAWSEAYNVEFRFVGSRRAGELYALCRLLGQEMDAGQRAPVVFRRKLAALYLLVRAEMGSVE